MSDNPVHHFKSTCSKCGQTVEFLTVFAGDCLCARCQYSERKERPKDQFGWTIHPDCKSIMDRQTAEALAGARVKRDLRAIRREKKARAMRGG